MRRWITRPSSPQRIDPQVFGAPDRVRSRLVSIRVGRVFRVIHRGRRLTAMRAVPAPSVSAVRANAMRYHMRRMRFAVCYGRPWAFGELTLPGIDELVHDAWFPDALDDYEITLPEPPE